MARDWCGSHVPDSVPRPPSLLCRPPTIGTKGGRRGDRLPSPTSAATAGLPVARSPSLPPSLPPKRASERAHKRARVRPPCQSRENERAKGFRQFLGGEKREDSIQQKGCPVASNTSSGVDWIPGDGRGNIMRESATSQPVSQSVARSRRARRRIVSSSAVEVCSRQQ